MDEAAAPAAAPIVRDTAQPGRREIRIEYEWVGARDARAPVVVFLHEGLGSVAMWRDFPARVLRRRTDCAASSSRATATGGRRRGRTTSAGRPTSCTCRRTRCCRALLARSRHRAAVALRPQRRRLDRAAPRRALPRRRGRRRRRAAPVRRGHLDRQHRARPASPTRRPTCAQRLARYHDDVDSAFCGWNDVWLAPDFRDWNIERELATIACPVLAVQGTDDEYGTLAQVAGDRARARAADHACS